MQFDAVFLPAVSVAKAPHSLLEGAANVMISPSAEAANIGYKIAQRTGGVMTVLFLVVSMTMPNLVF